MKPHVSASRHIREFSLRATLLGLLFGFFFAIANAYLALTIGQTISASIPAAILSMGVMKLLFRNATILEHNIVQTIATVGEGLAAGVTFAIPALFLLGAPPSIGRIALLSILGGILGILFMIPMRRYFIVEEHDQLPFPEGTACATILKAGEQSGRAALMAVWGVLVSAVYKVCTSAFFLWKESISWAFPWLNKAVFSMLTSPALLGVGYIIGPRIASLMFAGGLMAWWVIIPLIVRFGLGGETISPSTLPIPDMTPDQIWSNYVRYIGAGAVAIGGLMSLVKVIPLIRKTMFVGIKEFINFRSQKHLDRTDRDIPIAWLLFGSLAIILTLWLLPGLNMNLFTIVLLVILAFFFTAVCSFSVGLIGSSSSPFSGMIITTLLITCILFSLFGWTERVYLLSAIVMGCVISVAIAMAGTTSQDLKTGFLLGATPRSQQIAEILGVIIPALILGYTLYLLNHAYTIGSSLMPAPQAVLLSMIAKGVITGELPYGLAGIGIFIGVVLALLNVPILPFALGLYLPFSLTTPVLLGGIVRLIINRTSSFELIQERGTLFSAGLVGGTALIGIVLALLTVLGIIPPEAPTLFPDWVSFLLFLLLAAITAGMISPFKSLQK